MTVSSPFGTSPFRRRSRCKWIQQGQGAVMVRKLGCGLLVAGAVVLLQSGARKGVPQGWGGMKNGCPANKQTTTTKQEQQTTTKQEQEASKQARRSKKQGSPFSDLLRRSWPRGNFLVWGRGRSRKVRAELGILQRLWPTSPKALEAQASGGFRAEGRKEEPWGKRKKGLRLGGKSDRLLSPKPHPSKPSPPCLLSNTLRNRAPPCLLPRSWGFRIWHG